MIRILLLVLLVFAPDVKPKLTKTKVTKNITMLTPSDWTQMEAEDLIQRYPSVRAPLAAYTSPDRMSDLAVNVSATQWPDGNLKMASQFFKASLMNLFDKVDIISEGIKTIHKKQFIYFEFESRMNGNPKVEAAREPILKYSYVMYLIEGDRTTVFSFNCPRNMREEWQDVARQIMSSVKVN